jgi:hypothetical protein
MHNKFVRFLLFEPQFRIRALIFLAFVVLITIQLKILQAQRKHVLNLQAEKSLVLRTAEMENAIQVKMGKLMVDEEQPEVLISKLRGVMVQKEGAPYVLIDDTIYNEGDALGDYTIVSIMKGSTVLINKLTNEVKNLAFPELKIK